MIRKHGLKRLFTPLRGFFHREESVPSIVQFAHDSGHATSARPERVKANGTVFGQMGSAPQNGSQKMPDSGDQAALVFQSLAAHPANPDVIFK